MFVFIHYSMTIKRLFSLYWYKFFYVLKPLITNLMNSYNRGFTYNFVGRCTRYWEGCQNSKFQVGIPICNNSLVIYTAGKRTRFKILKFGHCYFIQINHYLILSPKVNSINFSSAFINIAIKISKVMPNLKKKIHTFWKPLL